MRDIITVSLPKESRQLLKKRIKERGFQGVSEYVRYLLELDQNVISQDELLKITEKADRDYEKGLLKKRSSLRDLL